jgi:uncharacterized protein YndB with AHSA1/START domain
VARAHAVSRAVRAFAIAASSLAAAASATAQDWILSAAERERLAGGEVLVLADVNASRGDVRAAVQIAAPAERIFRTMTDCAQALEFVPHLEVCRVLESAADGGWQLVEHGVDFSWYLPRIDYVFRAEYEPFRRIRFSHVSGDLRDNRGAWELTQIDAGTTILTYRVHLVPRTFVPGWVVRSSLRRDLPLMLRALRERCEED